MDRETCWQTIEQQRRSIADLLADLSTDEWETPSLCAGWRVREVAAHIALTPQPPPIGVMLATGIRARGNYNRFIDDLTRRYAKQPAAELVSAIRENAGSRTLPKLTNYRNILFDTMVHGQDIAIPLARTIDIEPAAAAAAATHAVTIGWPVWDKHRLDGIRLVASDVEWSHGSGPEILGPITALLLLITGRTAAIDLLTGDGVAPMTARLH
ncbi:maleylpyruvate isomerase family mycothiol-dependent enzyme [Nocardia anaemiae]|uniref:maleylpyruvate isomerase family mycothiol-dependent enzyme n=1 Tax=Nocardia anaemiae TaxID=263910 RepID=UPI0007A50E40|nr:maleylpyruvate isomerase family mycothiol-dependent enzyme [Nocardia anaemiae]